MPLEWIPSAAWPRSITCLRIYSRWENNGLVRGFKATQPTPQTTLLRFPHRTILTVWEPRDYPDPSEWETVHDFSPFEEGTVGRRMLSSVLISAEAAHDKTAIRDMERSRPGAVMHDMSTWNHSELEIMGDSGGAQLYAGKINYIDPKKVINFYNKGVNIGTACDIPPRIVDQEHRSVVRACAYAQRANNRVFHRERADGLRLLNVAHGFDLRQVRNFIDIVSGRNGEYVWDGWAVGSGAWLEMALLRNCITVLKEAPWSTTRTVVKRSKKSGKRRKVEVPYKHLHLFAVAGPSRMPFYAWLGKYIDRFTVDSTHWLQGVRYNRYLMLEPGGDLKLYPMGRERTKQQYIEAGTMPVPGVPLPCSCPVCSLLPTWDVFALPAKFRMYSLLAWHNIYTLQRLTAMWSNMAMTMDEDEYRDWAVYIAGEGAHFQIDFIEHCIHEGLDAANESERMTFAFEKAGHGAAHVLFPGAEHEDPNDPVSLLGSSNMLAGSTLPSQVETTLPNYLPPKVLRKLGLDVHPITKDRKRAITKKLPRKRYKYKQHSKEDLVNAIEQWLEEHPDVQIENLHIAKPPPKKAKDGTVTAVAPYTIVFKDQELILDKLKSNVERRAFIKKYKIPLPKLQKIGEVVLITDEEWQRQKDEEKKKKSRYRKKKVKRALRNKKRKK